MPSAPLDSNQPGREGLVLATHGILSTVLFGDGTTLRCAQPADDEYPVVGDRVTVETSPGSEPRISSIAARRNALKRAQQRNIQVLAANIDRLIVIVAPEPPPREGLIDRFFVAAESEGIECVICYNKLDMAGSRDGLLGLAHYTAAGYDLHPCSAHDGSGLEAIRKLISEGTSVLVGHSGVGKSSIINALLGSDLAATGEVSAIGKGRQTTTTAVAYRFGPALVIDTPGVRLLSLVDVEPDELRHYFPEFLPLAAKCRFGDCRHVAEEGCAVVPAAESGALAPARYRSYRKLLAELQEERLADRPYVARWKT